MVELPPKLIPLAPEIDPALVILPVAALIPALLPIGNRYWKRRQCYSRKCRTRRLIWSGIGDASGAGGVDAGTACSDEDCSGISDGSGGRKNAECPPEMEPEFLTAATFALMPNMLPEMVPILLVTLDALALMLMPPDMVPKLMMFAALVALMPKTPPVMVPNS